MQTFQIGILGEKQSILSVIAAITWKFIAERGIEGFVIVIGLAVIAMFGLGTTLMMPSDAWGFVKAIISFIAAGFIAYYAVKKVNL